MATLLGSRWTVPSSLVQEGVLGILDVMYARAADAAEIFVFWPDGRIE
jgi:hypothetical protein